jgi:hypothetical protein
MNKDEIQIGEEDEDIIKKGALGVISLNLYAVTIRPKLVIDKK